MNRVAFGTKLVGPSPILASLFSKHVIAFEALGPVDVDLLLPKEAVFVARAVPKRVAEFAAGRACARRALAELGVHEFALRVGPNREPLWPDGVTGSIAHTAGFCGVTVARKSSIQSLGIDAELRGAVDRALWTQIATSDEISRLKELPEDEAALLATLLFSAKESFFKCQFPLTEQWVDFRDVSVQVETANFEINPLKPLALATFEPPPWRGRHVLHSAIGAEQQRTLIMTGCSLGA